MKKFVIPNLSCLFTKPNKKIIFILLAIIIVLAALLVFQGKMKKIYIKNQIKKANYCQVDSDCQDAFAGTGGHCPFGCYAYVNKSEAGRIKYLIDSFESTCVYGCAYCPTAKCDKGRCEPVCEY